MSKKKPVNYQVLLSNERDRILKAVSRNRKAVNEIKVEHTEDEGDLAIISHDRELLFNLQESDGALLKSIDAALGRLTTGDYGECVNCGEVINERRLEAVPWVTTCIKCQEEKELAATTMVLPSGDEETPWTI